MIIRHGLLELTNYKNNKQSGIILNRQIIISSATILEPYLKDYTVEKSQIDSIVECLTESTKIIKVQDDKKFDFLKALRFEVILDAESNIKKIKKSVRVLTRYRANLLYLYNCEEIRECFKIILEKVNPLNNYVDEILASSFIILSFVEPNTQILYPNIDKFIKSVIEYDKFSKPIGKLDDIMTICSPFGLENFYKTINIGKISNIMGKKNCLFVISNTLPQGCEGSAVLNNKLRLIGILICTSLKRENENFSLCLVGNFFYVIKEFVNQYGIQYKSSCLSIPLQLTECDKSLVIIKSSNSQGTGIFVQSFHKKFILTCSHVLSKDELISCRYMEGTFTSKIIWKNPNYNEPYDIALLSVPSNVSDHYFVHLSGKKPRLGAKIYNAGFPFFTNIENINDYTFSPSLFEGRIIKYSPGVLISDGKLQAGQSGGPMFDEYGTVLGICVSNIKLGYCIYPNINTSVPICDIKKFLDKYSYNNDIKFLNNLIASPSIKSKWALQTPFIQSKL